MSDVIINVDNIYSSIDTDNKNVLTAIDDALSYLVPGHIFMKAYKTGFWNNKTRAWEKWDGRSRLFNKNTKRFLTGFLDRVIGILDQYKVSYSISDNRVKPKSKKPLKTKNIQPREYQSRVIDQVKKHSSGLISVATGGGKSILIAQTIAHYAVKSIVYVPGIDLLYQTRDAIQNVLEGVDVGIIGDGKVDIQDITVCTIWSAVNILGQKYESIDDEDMNTKEAAIKNKKDAKAAIENAELFIVDECHCLGTKTLQAINRYSPKAYYKFGYSGTVFRTDNADLLLEAVCGKQIVEVTASELIHHGYLVKPNIHFINIPEYDGDLPEKYQSIYKEYVVENEVRNQKIVSVAEKMVASGRRVLILVKNLRHGKILLEDLEQNYVVYFVRGNIDSRERNRIRKDFINGKIDIVIASVVYDQGIDIPNLDGLILAGSGKSAIRTLQRIGRVIRPCKGKTDAVVVDFIDNAKYLLNHTAARLEIYKRETGFDIKLPKRNEQDNDPTKAKKKTSKRKPVFGKSKGW